MVSARFQPQEGLTEGQTQGLSRGKGQEKEERDHATSPMGTAHRVISQRTSDRQKDTASKAVHLPARTSGAAIGYGG